MRNIVPVVIIAIVFGIRFLVYENNHQSKIPESWFDTEQSFKGVIIRDPDRGLTKTRIMVHHEQYGRLLVTLPTNHQVFYGDEVAITGMIQKPESFITETERIFNYPKYLAVSDIFAIVRATEIIVTANDQGNRIIDFLYRSKYHLVVTIKQMLEPRPAALLSGILLGEQSLFDKNTLESFQLAGLTHIIVLSGYNITLITSFFIKLFAYGGCGYFQRRIGALVAIPMFIIMTGMGTSLIRAGIMAMMTIIIDMMLRPNYSLRILLLTAGVMIFHNPRILLHSPSFHLSFIAFSGLAFVVPITKLFTSSLPSLYGIRDIIVETVTIQLFVLPYIIWMNGYISWLSVFANIFTIPIIPFLMVGGFFAVVIGFLFPYLGSWLMTLISYGLKYIVNVAEYVAGFTSSHAVVKPFSVWWMIGAYAILIIIIRIFYIQVYVQRHDSKITNT